MVDDDPYARAFEAAGRLLAHRARSAAELEQRLTAKGFEAEVVAATLARLEALRLLDDRAFARERAGGLVRRAGGPRLVRARLRAAGVSPEDAEAALGETLEEAGGEAEAAQAALRRRYGDLADAPPDKRRKAAAWLVRRGFAASVAGAVCGVFSDREA